ncbi:hypothetical protein FOH10_25645 [Nocardia otitidiscaviarum]|uniref:DUF1499 domain-containing protein n=1 Tax=Nocardia otitidiscaviarum TaxID=1823 RepID=A0A516NRS2_9NOCA|nr:hypothetical protein [Nocardia otitidiscaviarum]MCP9620808.1 hypothetical protein [Nocardia otitidiscaviarum]QDP81602.1 hypothetical protein FOH10_25645 [Nocardia otitidiscaviarum]
MSPLWRGATRIFLRSGLVFGIVMALYLGLISGSVWAGVIAGLIGGLLFGAIITGLSMMRARRDGTGHELGAAVRQQVSIDVQRPAGEAFAMAERVLAEVPATITRRDPAAGVLTARTKVSWMSWGENLQVVVAERLDGSTVAVSSRPRLPITTVDYGRNLQNVRSMVRALTVPT